MITVLQRVSKAQVTVEGSSIAAIGRGIMALVAVEKGDGQAEVEKIAQRILNYRMFADGNGMTNLNVADIGGSLLLVPQFTLAADTSSGNRPGFSAAADRGVAAKLFSQLVATAKAGTVAVAAGVFGADMQVELVNDGPVTFILKVAGLAASTRQPRQHGS